MAELEKETKPQAAFDQALISWSAPQYVRYHRGPLWYGIAGVLNLLLLGYAWFIAHSWTMLVLFIVVPVVYTMELRKKPKEVPVVISAYGIRFGDLRFAYSNIRSFWVLHEPPFEDELTLSTSQRLHPKVVIPLKKGVDVTLLRNSLVTQIPELEGQKKSLLDLVIRLLRLT